MSKTIKVPALSSHDIDAWPIAEAGLPARVVHGARNMNLQTVGQLRALSPERMLNEPRFGCRSLAAVKSFFRTCEKLQSGHIEFRDLREAFETLLPRRTWEMVCLRYGLEKPDFEISSSYYTLQSIANREGVTRERVRQVLALALAQLRSRWTQACLHPFEQRLIAVLTSRGGVADAHDFSDPARDPLFGGINPASAALLLSDAHPERWTHFGQIFLLAPASATETFLGSLRKAMKRENRPVPFSTLLKECPFPGFPNPVTPDHISRLLRQMDDVLLFRDGSCLFAGHWPAYLKYRREKAGGRISVSKLTEQVNRLLDPHSRKSEAAIRSWLMNPGRSESA